jgi:hypothetical protein
VVNVESFDNSSKNPALAAGFFIGIIEFPAPKLSFSRLASKNIDTPAPPFIIAL